MTQLPDPKDAPIAAEPDAAPTAEPEADQEEPDVEPFAGDDDILSGHLGSPDDQ